MMAVSTLSMPALASFTGGSKQVLSLSRARPASTRPMGLSGLGHMISTSMPSMCRYATDAVFAHATLYVLVVVILQLCCAVGGAISRTVGGAVLGGVCADMGESLVRASWHAGA